MKKLLVLAVAALTAIAVLAGCAASSSSDVSIVGDNTARIPTGSILSLTQTAGKTTIYWEITNEGENVHFSCSGFCSDTDVNIAETGETHTVESHGLLMDNFQVTGKSGGVVDVVWPYGMTFQK